MTSRRHQIEWGAARWERGAWGRPVMLVPSGRRVAWSGLRLSDPLGAVAPPAHPRQFTPKAQDADEQEHSLFARTFYEYMTNSSMHGLKYVGDLTLHLFERVFWAVAFILAVMAAAYFIFNLFNKFNESPVIMSLTPTTRKLNSIPFPAITICNMNNVRKTKAQSILKTENLYDRNLLNDFCQDGSSDEQEIIAPTWNYIQKFMIDVTQPCHEMLISCKWDGQPFDCTELFNPSFTDEGMCCTFNSVKRDLIFKNPRDLSDLNVTFVRDSIDWSPEFGYPQGAPTMDLPWRPKGAGSHMGLVITADVEIDEYYCSSENSIGFKVLLHNPIETPKITNFGTAISPGRENRVVIQPRITISEENLVSIEVEKRQCYFLHERNLRFYRTYSQRNCLLECEANFTLTFCKCVHYYMPKDKSTRICGKKDWTCADDAKKTMEMIAANVETKNKPKSNMTSCQCLPGCFEISYSMIVSESPLTDLLNVSKELLNKKDKAYFRDNMAIIQFFFIETQFTGFLRARLFGFTEFLSNTGGLLGLFLGFSFLSAVEIGYFISLRLWCSFSRQSKETSDAVVVMEKPTRDKFPFPFTQ